MHVKLNVVLLKLVPGGGAAGMRVSILRRRLAVNMSNRATRSSPSVKTGGVIKGRPFGRRLGTTYGSKCLRGELAHQFPEPTARYIKEHRTAALKTRSDNLPHWTRYLIL